MGVAPKPRDRVLIRQPQETRTSVREATGLRRRREEAATSSGMDARSPLEAGRGREDSPGSLCRGAQPWDTLDSEVLSLGLCRDGCLWF